MPGTHASDPPAGGALGLGARAILPLAIGILPFGIVYGVAVVESAMANWLGGLASTIVLAGAAQIALVDLIDQGAHWTVAIGTALAVNLRFVMYSGALAPSFAEYPAKWRVPLAYLMTDQTAVTSLLYNENESSPQRRMSYYLGAGLTFAGAWMAGSWIGVLIGAGIPAGLQLGFAIPLMFLSLLIPSIRNRSGLVAAVVGGAVALAASAAPYGTGLLMGAVAGIVAGTLVDR